MNILTISQSIFGILIFTISAWLIGKRSTKISKLLLSILLQIIFTTILLKIPFIQVVFDYIGKGLTVVSKGTMEGVQFVFGYLSGNNTPFEVINPNNTFIFAIHALPQIIVISSISMVLFHFGIMQKIVNIMGKMFKTIFGIKGPLSLFASAKIFLGQTDAPLLIKNYIDSMSKGEIFLIMTTGMSTTSFSIINLYESLLKTTISNPVFYILVSTINCISLSIILSKAVVPIDLKSKNQDSKLSNDTKFSNVMEAISTGASIGMNIVVSIITILIVLIAIIYIVNQILGVFNIDIQTIMGYIMFPISWLMGISCSESLLGGSVLGMKITVNEINAMIEIAKNSSILSESSRLILSCSTFGFANISSVGIQIAGLCAIAPSKKTEIIKLAPLALVLGTIVNCINATIIGLVYNFI
jgi:concentrative nucleoside transporter, CNT family